MIFTDKKPQDRKGFTIIELMISTIVFSLVLLAASAAIVQVGKKYYRGLTLTRTQSVARSTVEEISQSLQFSSQQVKVPNYPGGAINYGPVIAITEQGNDKDTFFFCIGTKRFSFAIDRKLSPAPNPAKKEKKHVLWVDEPNAGCSEAVGMAPAVLTDDNPSGIIATNGRELLDKNMRITKLSIDPKANKLWSITVSVANGDDDILIDNGAGNLTCEGSTFSAEFCAVSEISVNVSKRIQ